MNKRLKYCLIGGCGVPCLVVICLIIYVYAIIIRFEYEYKHGLNYVGAQHKYFTAMRSGDGQSAVYWAEQTIKYAIKEKRRYQEEWLGYAYELNGQNEEALQVYQELGKSIFLDLDVPRVKYKLGQSRDAFLGYCYYADDCLVKYSESLKKTKGSNDRRMALCSIRRKITMEQDGFYMQLSPFLEYKDFLDFMNVQYTGEHRKNCAAAMELFRAIDKEVGKNDFIHPDYITQREQILAERKAKGVKW